ncbi:biotin/lipoyl-binding protein [Eubacterium sp. MSJ-21]|jgi:biotin carboxyl carrier protein|nr:biotin/lipoyl-binding protein [Eubacterium sp. MSJ-21]
MKNYRITVNGTAYDVAVEELGAGAAPVAATPAPVAAAAPAPAAPAAPAAAAGSIEVAAPMPGKILNVKASVGTAVKKGDVILILEAMKMENDVVAPEDGTVASINVSAGDAVEAGDVLATLN